MILFYHLSIDIVENCYKGKLPNAVKQEQKKKNQVISEKQNFTNILRMASLGIKTMVQISYPYFKVPRFVIS